MWKLEPAKLAPWLALVLGCTKLSAPESAHASAPSDPPPPAPAALPAPPQPPQQPQRLTPAPPSTVQIEMEPICPGGYSGPYRGFLEDARRPIAVVLVGHYVPDNDIMACRLDDPPRTILTIAIPRTTFYPSGARTAKVLAGDALRPMFDEECTHVIACDDLNGNGACELPTEPLLNGYNDASRYLHASVSRPARFRLTMTSRDDRACRTHNYYSRCCPEGYEHFANDHTCMSLTGSPGQRLPARCP